jgi:hypothetical protein
VGAIVLSLAHAPSISALLTSEIITAVLRRKSSIPASPAEGAEWYSPTSDADHEAGSNCMLAAVKVFGGEASAALVACFRLRADDRFASHIARNPTGRPAIVALASVMDE